MLAGVQLTGGLLFAGKYSPESTRVHAGTPCLVGCSWLVPCSLLASRVQNLQAFSWNAMLAGVQLTGRLALAGDYRTQLSAKADAIADALMHRGYDFGFLHIKAVDDTGHDKLPMLKVLDRWLACWYPWSVWGLAHPIKARADEAEPCQGVGHSTT